MTARWTLACVALIITLLAPPPVPAAGGSERSAASSGATFFSARQYTGTSLLVAAIARDARQIFDRFFSPQGVAVQPFVLLDQEGNKHLTTLGLTLADAMIAAIDNSSFDPGRSGGTPQELRGVLQEIGDTVRVHVKGINGQGLHRSYVAIIELSPPVYRLLHETLATAWRPSPQLREPGNKMAPPGWARR